MTRLGIASGVAWVRPWKILIAVIVALASPACAQSVQQSGTVTQKHVPYWVTNGVIGDSGTSLDSLITSFGVTNNGGAGICVNSDRFNAAGRNQLCFGAATNAPAFISLQNFGTAPAEPLSVIINGASANFPSPTSPLPIVSGGTGASDAATARTNLGLGTMAVQNANSVAITGGSITGQPTPVNPTDVTIKSYVDAFAQGITVLAQSRLATAAVLPNSPTYNNGASGVGATLTAGSATTLTVDGTTANLNDVVLVKNQAVPAQNGIYTVTNAGGGVAWVLTRATYFNTAAQMKAGSYTFVTAGSTNQNNSFALQQSITTVGTDAVNFNLFNISGVAFGSNGQIQYNNSGVLAGFTMAGDCTISIPNITCAKTSGNTAVGSAGSSTDKSIPTWNGTGGTLLQNNSSITIPAANKISFNPDGTPTQTIFFPTGLATSSVCFGNGCNNLTHTTGLTGYYNTMVGFTNFLNATTASYNTGMGFEVMEFCTTCNYNTAIGEAALIYNITGNGNTGLGWKALLGTQTFGFGDYNTAVGYFSGNASANTGGTTQNTSVGAFSLGAAGLQANANTAIGYNAGGNITTGTQNALLGFFAGQPLTTGSNNTFVGPNTAGIGITTGSNNTLIGNCPGQAAGAANQVFVCDGAGNIVYDGRTRVEWVNIAAGGTTMNAKSAGVSSIARGGAGNYTVNFSPSWSTANQSCSVTPYDNGTGTWSVNINNITAALATIILRNGAGTLTDPSTAILVQCQGAR